MAAHYRDNILHGKDHPDTHASENRWRHQESSAFAHHASHESGEVTGNVYSEGAHHGEGNLKGDNVPDSYNELDVKCGPLLNYRRMENQTWFGSVLIVTAGGGLGGGRELQLVWKARASNPESRAFPSQHVDSERGNSVNGTVNGWSVSEEAKVSGTKLYSDPSNTFWRFDLVVPMQQLEVQCEYKIPGLKFTQGAKTDKQTFFIPAISESMRIMFHSCNGFSVGTDEDAWSGPALWHDVMRVHQKSPFHVMLGGGDQIYNDGIRVTGPLRKWTDIANPNKRRNHPFPEELRRECDEYYVNNYIRWYGTEPFAGANGKIPQVNLWDDHDIIDGFGSYTDDFMKCSVFRGIGGVAHKYYMLFQHHLAPPVSTFTTDGPESTSTESGVLDPRQLENTFVLEEKTIDSSYIIGPKPGSYVAEHSRSIYARLGARIAFFGIDARTERTRHQVNYPETYDAIFSRLRIELEAAASSSSPIQHLVVLLGIPIAYPRLTWLENIFSSPVMGPLKFLNKRFGFGGGFFNHFDGSVDLLDDLDDHYTARTHKKERLFIVQQLQALAAEFSVRISILGGDVHLAAVGRFYSNPKLNVPLSADHRYMANVISSAIVNKPPPQAVANLLARRNKIHHLDANTDETLLRFFDKDPGKLSRTSSSNHVTMPSRNWAMITENSRIDAGTNGSTMNGHTPNGNDAAVNTDVTPSIKDGHSWLHKGEVNAGTTHKAADSATHGTGSDGSLDVMIRVEIDQHDKMGTTRGYGMTIPKLVYDGAAENMLQRKRDAVQNALHP